MSSDHEQDIERDIDDVATAIVGAVRSKLRDTGQRLWSRLTNRLSHATLPERAGIDARRLVLVAQGALEVALSQSNVDLVHLKPAIARVLHEVDALVWALEQPEVTGAAPPEWN